MTLGRRMAVTAAGTGLLVGTIVAAPATAIPAAWSATGTQAATVVPATPRTDYAAAIATLKAEIPALMADGKVVGLTIGLVDGRRTVWKAGFGMANRERDRKVTPQTLFHIGSTSKTMTAMAVMQLVERGLVDLDAPLTRYIPAFRMLQRFHHNVVTVRSIMTHHSGIPGDLVNLAEFGNKPESDFQQQALRQLRKQLPTRHVGKAWAYSNMAIQLLQGVVENASGESFLAYTRRHIFKPLGMLSTSFDDAKQSGVRVAAPYQVVANPDGSPSVIRRAREYVNIRPAGSVYSNADDMVRYLKAMIGFGKAPGAARVLRRSTVQTMITPQKASPWDRMFFKQGLVWWIGYGAPWLSQVVNHGGDTYFHHTMAAWLPSQRLGVFVSVNTANPTNVTKKVWQRALALMLQAKTGTLPPGPPPPKPVVAPDPAGMRAMAGTYANSSGVLQVDVAGNALRITSSAQSPSPNTRLVTLRSDGWYTNEDGSESLRMTTIDGHKVLLGRQPDGTQGLVAERLPKGYAIPRAWQRRAGIYRIRGVSKNVYPLMLDDPHLAALTTYRGVLLLNSQVLLPVSGTLAFTFGPSTLQVMRSAGFAVEARAGTLRWMGARLVPLPAQAGALAHGAPAAPIAPWLPPLVPQVG